MPLHNYLYFLPKFLSLNFLHFHNQIDYLIEFSYEHIILRSSFSADHSHVQGVKLCRTEHHFIASSLRIVGWEVKASS